MKIRIRMTRKTKIAKTMIVNGEEEDREGEFLHNEEINSGDENTENESEKENVKF